MKTVNESVQDVFAHAFVEAISVLSGFRERGESAGPITPAMRRKAILWAQMTADAWLLVNHAAPRFSPGK